MRWVWEPGRATSMILFAAGLVLYAALWLGSWHGLFPFPALRVFISFSLFLVPGFLLQQLLWRGADVFVSQRLVLGLALSISLVSVGALFAFAFQLALPFIEGVFLFVSIICAVALLARAGWKWNVRIVWDRHWIALAPLLLAFLAAIWLTMNLTVEADDLTYTSYITHWQRTPHFDFQEIFFGIDRLSPSRFWLSHWLIAEAVFADIAKVHALELGLYYLSPLLAVMSLIATYALARRLGLSRSVATFAMCAQIACLMLLAGRDLTGEIFFNRLVEDKVVAAFLLTPALAIAVIAYLEQPTKGRIVLVFLSGAAMVVTHPIMSGLACLILGLYALFDLVVRRRIRATLVIFALLGILIAALLAQRVLDSTYVEKLQFDVTELRKFESGRVWYWGEQFFGASFSIVAQPPYLVVLLASILALFQFKSSQTARWILANALLVTVAVLPLTGWILAFAITASQLYRVPWFTPFGICAAFLVLTLWSNLAPSLRQRFAGYEAQTLYGLAALLVVGAAVVLSLMPTRDVFQALQPRAKGIDQRYADLIALGNVLDARLGEPVQVVGSTNWINDRLPSVSANARLVSFRREYNMWQLGNLTQSEAEARAAARRRLTGRAASADTRYQVLTQYQVKYIVAQASDKWISDLIEKYPGRFELVTAQGNLRLYQFKP